MTDIVDETLSEWRRHHFQYGEWDCVLSMSRYFAKLGAPDATDRFRGTYDSHEDAMRILAEHGGMAVMMEIIGGSPVDGQPRRGDAIGLLYREDGEDIIAALCTGDRVVVRLERGIIEVPLRLVEWRGIWRVVR